MHKPFIDRYARLGRPIIAPDSEMKVKAQPLSRSLNELSKFDAESRSIHASVKRGKLRLDLQHVIGDNIIVKKKDALAFAYWILETYKEFKKK